jgi:hypothetical protein
MSPLNETLGLGCGCIEGELLADGCGGDEAASLALQRCNGLIIGK